MHKAISQELLKIFQSEYIQLKNISKWDYLAEGEENWVYRVQANKKQYVIRISKAERTAIDFKFEYEYSSYLESHNIPVPKQYLTVNNDYFCKVQFADQERTVCLFDFIEGKIVTTPSKTQIVEVARLIGRIHSASVNFNPGYDRLESFDPLYWLNDLKKLETKSLSPIMGEVFEIYLELSDNLSKSLKGLIKVPLHNDINFNNILFLGNEIQALLDFDECHKHFIECELGWSINKICNFGNYDNYLENIDIFFENYLKYYSLTKEQIRIVYQVLVCEVMRKYYKHMLKVTGDKDDTYYSNVLKLYKLEQCKNATE